MTDREKNQSLQDLLVDQLDSRSVQEILEALGHTNLQIQVLELLGELREVSSKIQGEAIRGLGELFRNKALSSVVPWLDLGITLSQASGALGLRYFKESPGILGFWEPSSKTDHLLAMVLDLADSPSETAAQCAYEYFKALSEFPADVSIEELQQWAALGFELAGWDYVLGNEFFRECPNVQRAIPLELAKGWTGFGMKLMVQNSLGKPDYIGTLEFFRSSPSLFLEIPEPEVKERVIDLGTALADQSPEQAVLFLAEAPGILSGLPSEEWKNRVLKFGLLIADRDAEAVLAYCRRVPEVIQYSNAEDTSVFDGWFSQGMEALEYSAEAGRAFFGMETRQACEAVEEAMTGVSLRQVLRSLKIFARALSGQDVSIEALNTDLPPLEHLHGTSSSSQGSKAKVAEDGQTIYLPLVMKRSTTLEGNRRWYTAMVAHEVGHLEFGTYRISSQVLHNLADAVGKRSGATSPSSPLPVYTLGDLFQRYSQPELMRDLWEILEDGRVDFLLKHEYPGLAEDFSTLIKEAIQLRTLTHGMTAREMVLDALLLRFSGLDKELVSEPGLQDIIEPLWTEAQTILSPRKTVNDSVVLADRLYHELERRVGHWKPLSEKPEPFPGESGEEHAGTAHEATETMEEDYRPFDNWGYRSPLDPQVLAGISEDQETDQTANQEKVGGQPPAGGQPRGGGQKESQSKTMQPNQHADPSAMFGESPLQQWFQPEPDSVREHHGKRLGEGQYLYQEWDGLVGDYRPQWCRVIEHEASEGSPDFVDDTFRTYGAVIKMIRRYFEGIRPEAFRRIGRQSDGEDIDCDAMVNWLVDRKRGADPSDQIYASRQKRDRQVAVAFLIDMSGSTGRQMGSGGRTVNDIEKEGLLVLSEALSAVGDQFAIYGFSGKSRQSVDLQVIKDFTHRAGGRVGLKISGIRPRQQNRDGAAIRHAASRLFEQSAKVRLLVLLSDGKPLDDHYTDEYALEDTKMALREARLMGIHPFCITIDQAATDYVKRMYGEVGYLVVDEIDSLPTRLPKIYQRLTAR
ncbi:MAG: nitric oxide reductase activation protein NorD [Nitrospirales bacterium]